MNLQLIFKKSTQPCDCLLLIVFFSAIENESHENFNKTRFGNSFDFSTPLGHSVKVFYVENYKFSPKRSAASVINGLELENFATSVFLSHIETTSKHKSSKILPQKPTGHHLQSLLNHSIFSTLETSRNLQRLHKKFPTS